MKIAIINENSQASKNSIIVNSLKKVIKDNDKIINIGMFNNDDKSLTYVENGLMAAVLLNTGMADFIITGCGTGSGAMLALNSFPGVFCGLITDPLDAYLFSQINGGNAISIPYAKGFGWGSELQLEYIFEKLFKDEFGGGYPIERKEPEQRNAKILADIKNKTTRNMIDILKDIDDEMVKQVFDRESFKNILHTCNNSEIKEYLEQKINE
ncbi:MAG: RpiB/LacA/LacB family sugar-phosphate isomerase [Bacilli bacterium]|nr:RpiB/LacA/LacB family sugar-phosphate isomerase [Bacilli bacterium]